MRTRVETREGVLDFQKHYFVPAGIRPAGGHRLPPFAGADKASRRQHPGLLSRAADIRLLLAPVIICPSNPFISASIPSRRCPNCLLARFAASAAPVIAVSPIIAGRAVKGPTAKMMTELGLAVDPLTVAAHYGDLIDGYVMDDADSQMAAMLDLPVETTHTLMQSLDDREALARAVLDFADRIAARTAKRMSGGRS